MGCGCISYLVQRIRSARLRRKRSNRPEIGPPTDFRRVEFVLPISDTDDFSMDEKPTYNYRVVRPLPKSRTQKIKDEAQKLKYRMAEVGLRRRLWV
ncbi:hypothetical protein AJ80_07006 [Polytolypa hystricis UAMH7299]|uniref:Uncharacterized protein n=1 Tax=Polytolypa hystricis (strain UAMH7299) TaxID=1447883 RepID=A0A2B7XS15_POLH7|nr:hypothetical protein AJ80_07006 [Polytolypa hystricis UAMH7299]